MKEMSCVPQVAWLVTLVHKNKMSLAAGTLHPMYLLNGAFILTCSFVDQVKQLLCSGGTSIIFFRGGGEERF